MWSLSHNLQKIKFRVSIILHFNLQLIQLSVHEQIEQQKKDLFQCIKFYKMTSQKEKQNAGFYKN